MLELAYDGLLKGALFVLAVLVICSMIRSVLGPKISDRIIAVNMTGTLIIVMIAVLSVFLDENYLVDICLIYAMISFLGVVVLCKVYTGVYLRKKHMEAGLLAVEDNLRRQGLEDGMTEGKAEEAGQASPSGGWKKPEAGEGQEMPPAGRERMLAGQEAPAEKGVGL